jgi:hypothetical protein
MVRLAYEERMSVVRALKGCFITTVQSESRTCLGFRKTSLDMSEHVWTCR